jgi:hypothetical protein
LDIHGLKRAHIDPQRKDDDLEESRETKDQTEKRTEIQTVLSKAITTNQLERRWMKMPRIESGKVLESSR